MCVDYVKYRDFDKVRACVDYVKGKGKGTECACVCRLCERERERDGVCVRV